MATLHALQNDITAFFNTATLRLNTAIAEFEVAERFAKSPMVYAESPHDKPLPPLPTPIEANITSPRIPTPSNESQLQVRAPVYINSNDQWQQQYLNSSADGKWIDSFFADSNISFGETPDGYAWRLGRKVYEKAHMNSKQSYATAIYECSQTRGRVRGPKAYVKVYMQIPCYCNSCDEICAKPATMPKRVTDEIAALKRMCQMQGDVPAPRLLAMKTKVQSRRMWVPGGFLTFIVMQRLPGIVLKSEPFWSLPATAREDIRTAFKKSLTRLWQAGVLPRNCAINRVAWDPVTKKCFILNLEGCEIGNSPIQWWDHEYSKWGLSRGSYELSGTPIQACAKSPAELINNKIKLALDTAAIRDSPSPTFEMDTPYTTIG